MAGSSFGTLFRVTTWGESHGKAIGAVVDGCPAGLELSEADIQAWLDRRKPGQNRYTSARAEADQVEILSGVFEGKTEGTPISMIIYNKDQHSEDYKEIASYYRPGHADQAYDMKYGFRDYRGGGRSSGRETIGRVAGGAIAAKVLRELGISLLTWTQAIGPVACSMDRFDPSRIAGSPLYMPDEAAEERAQNFLEECIEHKTSAGGTVECHVTRMIPGVGEPVFDKLDAVLGQALFSIGAVKAVEIGDGIECTKAYGHENNDWFVVDKAGKPRKASGHAGGIYGGIADGSDLRIRVHFKPTPSVSAPQQALFKDGSVHEVEIGGRHDPVIVPRAVVVVESMTAMTVLDLVLRNMASTLDGIKKFYKN